MPRICFALFVALLCFSPNAISQACITGRILDVTHRPIAGAVVLLYFADTDTRVKTQIADANGAFRLEGISPAQYRLLVVQSGYETMPVDVIVGEKGGQDLGAVVLWKKEPRLPRWLRGLSAALRPSGGVSLY